jgi:predicted RNA-binding Zn-ribbon protein involved in translation (DUF1610 family)
MGIFSRFTRRKDDEPDLLAQFRGKPNSNAVLLEKAEVLVSVLSILVPKVVQDLVKEMPDIDSGGRLFPELLVMDLYMLDRVAYEELTSAERGFFMDALCEKVVTNLGELATKAGADAEELQDDFTSLYSDRISRYARQEVAPTGDRAMTGSYGYALAQSLELSGDFTQVMSVSLAVSAHHVSMFEKVRLRELLRGEQIPEAQRPPRSQNSSNDKTALLMDCQGCGKRLRLPASTKDITIRCPNCGTHKRISGQG